MSAGTGVRGVYAHKDGGFTASIGVEGARVYLGRYRTIDEAQAARRAAEIKHFGEAETRLSVVVEDSVAHIPLYGRHGVMKGWAVVDAQDLPIVADVAWTIDPRGYVAGRPSRNATTTMHAWIMRDRDSGVSIDHIDGDRLNNRRSNLRVCSQAENSRNRGRGTNNTSGFKGVSRTESGRWRARIVIDRKEFSLGRFDTKEAAAKAYDLAASRLHGKFARLNLSHRPRPVDLEIF